MITATAWEQGTQAGYNCIPRPTRRAYDNLLMANRIAEHPDVLLPLMVCQDGFITSHAIESIELLEDDKAKGFVGTYKLAVLTA